MHSAKTAEQPSFLGPGVKGEDALSRSRVGGSMGIRPQAGPAVGRLRGCPEGERAALGSRFPKALFWASLRKFVRKNSLL